MIKKRMLPFTPLTPCHNPCSVPIPPLPNDLYCHPWHSLGCPLNPNIIVAISLILPFYHHRAPILIHSLISISLSCMIYNTPPFFTIIGLSLVVDLHQRSLNCSISTSVNTTDALGAIVIRCGLKTNLTKGLHHPSNHQDNQSNQLNQLSIKIS